MATQGVKGGRVGGLLIGLALVALAAVPLGSSQADASQGWFVTSADAPPTGSQKTLMQGSSGPDEEISIPAGTNVDFAADSGAVTAVAFGENSWKFWFNWSGSASAFFTITVTLGKMSSAGIFSAIPGASETLTANQGTPSAQADVVTLTPTEPLTFAAGQHIALRISQTNTVLIAPPPINLKGFASTDSVLRSPTSDPGYPAWQLGSVAILGAGLMGVAVLAWRRRA